MVQLHAPAMIKPGIAEACNVPMDMIYRSILRDKDGYDDEVDMNDKEFDMECV